MEAETYVEPQVSIELLSEYADKLRSLAAAWFRYYRRKVVLDVLFFFFGGIAVLSFGMAMVMGVFRLFPSETDILGIPTLVFLSIALVTSLLYLVITIMRNADIGYLDALGIDILSLSGRLERLVKIYSQRAEHVENDRHRLSELDIRLTDAEGALRYVKAVERRPTITSLLLTRMYSS